MRLLTSAHAVRSIPEDKLAAVAKEIGVDVDLLAEVRAQAKIRKVSGKHAVAKFVTTGRYHDLELVFPDVHWGLWIKECKTRNVEPATLLRSLIHDLLLKGRLLRPEELHARWDWNGVRHSLPKAGKNYWKNRQVVGITPGAHRALIHHARAHNCSVTTLVRTLIMETLKGRHRSVRLVQRKHLYDDELRYLQTARPGALDPQRGAR